MKTVALALVTTLLILINSAATSAGRIEQGAVHSRSSDAGAVTLTAADAADFVKAIETVSQQARVAIIAEDAPVIRTLPQARVQSLAGSFTRDDALGKIADLYDYEIVPVTQNAPRPAIVLLRKKFTSEHDMPDVTFAECKATMQDLERAVQPYLPYPPADSNTNLVLDIADALTPEQQQMLSQGGIAVRDLTPEQRKQVWRLAQHMYMGLTFSFLTEATDYLAAAEKKGVARVGKAAEATLFRYSAPDQKVYGVALPGAAADLQFVQCAPLVVPNYTRPGSNGGASNADAEWITAFIAKTPATRTLQAVAEDLNKASASSAKAPRFRVAPEASGKHVTVAGRSFADRGEFFKAVAELLDLRIRRPSQANELLMSRRFVNTQVPVSELHIALRNVLPDALRRYLHGEIFYSPPPVPGAAPLPEEKAPAVKPEYRFVLDFSTVQIMHTDLVRNLKEKEVVPFASLGDAAKNAFALRWMLYFAANKMTTLSQNPPNYVTRFDEARLMGGWTQEGREKRFTATIVVNGPNGVESAGFMVGNKRL